jgi:glycosyltransferase involved in cell wall biosynthesis
MNIAALLPAYNEESNIADVAVCARTFVQGVIVVDDGSHDGTARIASRVGAEVIRHEVNQGKGAALRTGFARALSMDVAAVVTLDGDGQHNPAEIPLLVRCWQETGADIIIGNRMGAVRSMPFYRIFTNRASSTIVSLLCSARINDTQSGFRLISTDVLRTVPTTLCNYEMETELLVKAARTGFRIAETPVSTIYHKAAPSKIRPLRDAYKFLRASLRLWLSRPRKSRIPNTVTVQSPLAK